MTDWCSGASIASFNFCSLLIKKLYPVQIRDETPGRAVGVSKAVSELYDVITHDLLTSNLRSYGIITYELRVLYILVSLPLSYSLTEKFSFHREQFDTWNILAKARNEGRLFSRIQWPRDPEIVCFFLELSLPAVFFIHNVSNIYCRRTW